MVLVNFHVDEKSFANFKKVVGDGNMSNILRKFIESFSKKEDYDLILLKKKLDVLYKDKVKIDTEFYEIKNKIEVKETQIEMQEIKNMEEDKEEERIITNVAVETMKKDLHRLI